MKLKSTGVVMAEVKPEMYYYCGVADEVFWAVLGVEFVVTNAFASRAYPSFHTKGLAVDGRTSGFFDWLNHRHQPDMIRAVKRLRERLDKRGFDIVLEPDELTEKNLATRFSDTRMDALIGHHDRERISAEQFEVLRRAITPHLHGELDRKPGEILWPTTE